MSVVTVIPMTVEEALKAADSYSHLAINGSMVQVLAAEVRRLRQLTRGQTFVTETTPLETKVYPPSFKGWTTEPCQNCGHPKSAHPGLELLCPSEKIKGEQDGT